MFDEKQDKPITRVTDLAALATETVDVTLEFEDHIEVVPMKTLSYAEWQRIGWSVPNPIPPVSGVDSSKRPIFDLYSPQYIEASQRAELERAYKRLLASMALPVPGADEAEQIDYLKRLDANRVRMLISAVNELAAGGRSHVSAKAQFPDRRGNGAGAGVSTDGQDAG